MDKNQNNKRPNAARKVNISETPLREPVRQHKRTAKEMEAQIRYQQQQKQKRLAIQRRRALIALIVTVITVIVLMCMTPIFNIRRIAVSGNNIVTLEEINSHVGDLIGKNLFKTGEADISRRLKAIPYIDEVNVAKRLIPPTLRVGVTECRPAAYIGINSETFVVDSNLKILGDRSVFSEGNIPNVIGVETASGNIGEKIYVEDSETLDILCIALKTMEQTGILDKIRNLDISEQTNITFTYDNRLDVLCGSQLNLERKLRLFKETVSNNNLPQNAEGMLDLSATGKAVYNPR